MGEFHISEEPREWGEGPADPPPSPRREPDPGLPFGDPSFLCIPLWLAHAEEARFHPAGRESPSFDPKDAAGRAGTPEKDIRRSLGRLRVAGAALDRRVGQGLRLLRDGRHNTMAVGALDYVHLAATRLGIGSTKARELARLAEGLERYPLLEQAYDAGLVSRSNAVLILGVIRPETEPSWVARAVGWSYRRLRRAVREHRRCAGQVLEAAEEETAPVTLCAAREDMEHLWSVGTEMVEKVTGGPVSRAGVLEALCAEWASGHPEEMPEIVEGGGRSPKPVLDLETLLAMGGRIVEGPEAMGGGIEEVLDRGGPGNEDGPMDMDLPPGPAEGDLQMSAAWPEPSDARDTEELVEILVSLMALRQSLNWQAGRALRWCWKRQVEFDSAEALGVSPREARYLIDMDGELRWRPRVRDAYITGRLGWMKARLVLRLCTDQTAEAWIGWAETSTLRLLERVVDAEERVRARGHLAWRRTTGGLPPTEKRMRALGILPGCMRATEARILEVANVRREEGAGAALEGAMRSAEERTTCRLRLPVDLAALVKGCLLALMTHLDTTDQGACLRHLVERFCRTYQEEHRALGGSHPGRQRDGYLCQYPGCTIRITEGDHMISRSRGGADELWNIISLCPRHHRYGKHMGYFQVHGHAPDDVWFILNTRRLQDRGQTPDVKLARRRSGLQAGHLPS